MEKPGLRTREYLDYIECRDWINHKYKIDTRNYAGKKYDGSEGDPPYQDFWHFVIDNSYNISNGCFFWLSVNQGEYTNTNAEPWQMEILSMFKEEFKEFIDGDIDDEDACIEFWVSW